MKDYTAMPAQHHLELDGREKLTVSGVEDVERFDESSIIMSTSAGVLVVTHDHRAIDVFDRIWVMEDGKIERQK